MLCPYCKEKVDGPTGLVEAENFREHLEQCAKFTGNFVMSDGVHTVITPKKPITLNEALEIREESGQ